MTHTTNKLIKEAYEEYLRADKHTLFETYNTHSNNKQKAYDYCLLKYDAFEGVRGIRILTYNTFQFTVGFIGYINNKQVFIYITKDYDRYIYLDELRGQGYKVD